MSPKQMQLPIFIQAKPWEKTKNLPRTTTFGWWSFNKVFYKTTTYSRQPLLSGSKSGCLTQVWMGGNSVGRIKYDWKLQHLYLHVSWTQQSEVKSAKSNHKR